jgi:hypothetical protein
MDCTCGVAAASHRGLCRTTHHTPCRTCALAEGWRRTVTRSSCQMQHKASRLTHRCAPPHSGAHSLTRRNSYAMLTHWARLLNKRQRMRLDQTSATTVLQQLHFQPACRKAERSRGAAHCTRRLRPGSSCEVVPANVRWECEWRAWRLHSRGMSLGS